MTRSPSLPPASYGRYLSAAVAVVATAAVFALGFGVARAFFPSTSRDNPKMEAQQSQATPIPSPVPTPLVLRMPLSAKVGQLIMAGFSGTTADGATELITRYHLGNVVLAGGNVGSPDDVLALTTRLQMLAQEENGEGLLISIDQEGGRVTRLPPPWCNSRRHARSVVSACRSSRGRQDRSPVMSCWP